MANWLEQAFGIADESESVAPPKPRPPKQVEFFWCVVAQPSGAPGDLGETVPCYYYVRDGVLRLCDENGNSGEKQRTLAPGEEPRRVASQLRQEAWQRERSPFDRPLRYGSLGLA